MIITEAKMRIEEGIKQRREVDKGVTSKDANVNLSTSKKMSPSNKLKV